MRVRKFGKYISNDLNYIQNEAAKIVTGATKLASIDSLHTETGLETLGSIRKTLKANHVLQNEKWTFLFNCTRWVGLQTLWQFWNKDISIDEKVGAWRFGCCQPHWGLPVGFILLWYSALCTVGSLYLLYLLFYILVYIFWEMMHG